jgi:hypothetical protein
VDLQVPRGPRDRILASWSLVWDQLAGFGPGSKLSLLCVSRLMSRDTTQVAEVTENSKEEIYIIRMKN